MEISKEQAIEHVEDLALVCERLTIENERQRTEIASFNRLVGELITRLPNGTDISDLVS